MTASEIYNLPTWEAVTYPALYGGCSVTDTMGANLTWSLETGSDRHLSNSYGAPGCWKFAGTFTPAQRWQCRVPSPSFTPHSFSFAFKMQHGTITPTKNAGFGVQFANSEGVTFSVWFASSGFVHGYRGVTPAGQTSAPSSVSDSTATFTTNQWHWVKIQVVAADSGGTCTVDIDGETFINFSGDTKSTTTAGIATFDVILGSGSTAPSFGTMTLFISDFVCSSSTVGVFPEGVLARQAPTSDESVVLTPSTGGSNYATIDETSVDTADYNEGSSTGLEDRYATGSLPFSPASIQFVTTHGVFSRDGAVAGWELGVRSGSTTDRAASQSPGGSGAISSLQASFLQDPNTAASWTEAGANGAKITVRTA